MTISFTVQHITLTDVWAVELVVCVGVCVGVEVVVCVGVEVVV